MIQEWWRVMLRSRIVDSSGRGDLIDIDDVAGIISEAQRHEREKWLAKIKDCLSQMPVAGNGRRLLMLLISEMEKYIWKKNGG